MATLEKDVAKSLSGWQKIAMAAFFLIIALTLQLVLGSPGWADVTYDYNGPVFTTINTPPGPTYANITGSVTFSSVPPGGGTELSGDISSWQLTSGSETLSSADTDLIGTALFNFDAAGNITGWSFTVEANNSSSSYYPQMELFGNSSSESDDYLAAFGKYNEYSGINTYPWSAVPAAVPAPCSLLLLGSGLAGLATWRRFRKG